MPQPGEVWRHRYSENYWLITDRGAVYLYGGDQRPGYSLPGVIGEGEYVRVAESPAEFFATFRVERGPPSAGAFCDREKLHMTHYPVFVLCNKGQNPEDLLAPYEEYGAQGTITKFTTWRDETDEVLKEWESGSSEMVVMPDGSLKWPWDNEFKVPGALGWCSDGSTHQVPAQFLRREASYKEIYGTLERYVKDYHGYDPIPDRPGRFGYMHNPKGYWDWYVLGGRWRQRFASSDVFSFKAWNGQAPQAIITPDGEWHARGEVGWFGYWGGEDKQADWEAQVRQCLAVHPDCLIHNFDLHT